MKIKTLITIYANGESHPPQSIIDIDDNEAISLIKREFAVAENDHASSTKATIDDIIDAIDMLSPETDFTKSGTPKVEAIEAILEQNISSEERDKAWELYSKNDDPNQ